MLYGGKETGHSKDPEKEKTQNDERATKATPTQSRITKYFIPNVAAYIKKYLKAFLRKPRYDG